MTISVIQSVSSGIDFASSRNASLTAAVESGDVAVAFGLLNNGPGGLAMSASGLTGGTWETIDTGSAVNTPAIGAMVCTGFTANGAVTVNLGSSSQSSLQVLLLRGVPAGAEFEFVSVGSVSTPITGPEATAPVFVIDVFATKATAAQSTWSRAGYTDTTVGIQSNNINATFGAAYQDAASGTPGTSLATTSNSSARIGQLRITAPADPPAPSGSGHAAYEQNLMGQVLNQGDAFPEMTRNATAWARRTGRSSEQTPVEAAGPITVDGTPYAEGASLASLAPAVIRRLLRRGLAR